MGRETGTSTEEGSASSRCAQCGTELDATAKFCSECGRQVSAPDDSEAAEHRPLTIVFVDLVGSTALSEQVDPEDLRDVMRAYYAICEDAIGRYDGFVVKYMGDGAMAYFGYPVAHDDDPQRAVLAGLEIAHVVPQLLRQRPIAAAKSLDVRVGIHSGSTVVGEVGGGATAEALAVGDTPNIAARLEASAPVGSVVVSETTHALIADRFDFEDLGPQSLKGVSEPVRSFRVVRPVEHARTGLRREHLVGRADQLAALTDVVAELDDVGETHVVIVAESGMGKSRLIAAAEEATARNGVEWRAISCSPFSQQSFLHPFIIYVERLAGIAHDDTPADRRAKLKRLVDAEANGDGEALALLLALLSLPLEEESPLELSPQVRKERTFALITDLVRRSARESPAAVLVVEDLHWADPSTVDLLEAMARDPHPVPLLVLATARPASIPYVQGRVAAVRVIGLDPLSRGQAADLARMLAADQELSPRDLDRIVDRADGVPLFLEALVSAILDPASASDRRLSGESSVPATLRGLLMAQLDRLGLDKQIVQHASLLGTEFRADLLGAVVPASVDVPSRLDVLCAADIMIRRTTEDPPLYEFRHALLREVAYESLLRRTRARLHEQVARLYEDRFPQEVESRPELLAEHWERANHDAAAATYYQLAADRSVELDANEEALTFLDGAERTLRRILAAEGDERDGDGDPIADDVSHDLLSVLERKGELLTRMRRLEDAEAAFNDGKTVTNDPIRLAALHRHVGVAHSQDRRRGGEAFAAADALLADAERNERWRAEWLNLNLAKLRMHYWFGEGAAMSELVEQIRPSIEQHSTPLQRVEFYEQLTLTDFRRERYAMSDITLRHAREYVRAAEGVGDTGLLAESRFFLAFCLLFGFQPQAARRELTRALELARRSGNRAIEVRTLAYLATAARLEGDLAGVDEHVSVARDEAAVEDMGEYVALADSNLAWVALREGDLDRARALSDDALGRWRSMEMVWPFRWLGAVPRFVVASDDGDPERLRALAVELCEESQHQLPPSLSTALRKLVDAPDDEHVLAAGRATIDLFVEVGVHR